MRPVLRLPIVAAAAVFLIAAAPADSREPDGYWQGALHGYTPQTLAGATVVDAGEVAKLIEEHKPVLLDVSEIDRKPAGLPPGGLWFPIHRNIPGSTWLPGSGEGDLDATAQDALKARIADLTGGDLERPIVTYCHPDCWGSWNLGKRLVTLGYPKVHWFPQGIEGWQDGHDTAVSRPDARWAARPKSTVGQ